MEATIVYVCRTVFTSELAPMVVVASRVYSHHGCDRHRFGHCWSYLESLITLALDFPKIELPLSELCLSR